MNKPVRIGINGFGRIGRATARIILDRPNLQLAAINSRANAASHAYLLHHDSTYGTLHTPIKATNSALLVGDREIPVFQQEYPVEIPWDRADVDVVIDATGSFLSVDDLCAHAKNAPRLVILSAPAKDAMKTIVLGVNESTYDPKQDTIISNSSCTTNCLAVVLKSLHDALPVKRAVMQTVHAMTDSQNILDNSYKKEKRLGRTASGSIIPASTGSSRDIAKLFPDLAGKITCQAVRVPVETVSLMTITAEISKSTTKDALNDIFRHTASGTAAGILQVASEELVSRDFTGNTHSAIIDPFLTEVTDGTVVSVSAWYDNEWGYASRLVDLIEHIVKHF